MKFDFFNLSIDIKVIDLYQYFNQKKIKMILYRNRDPQLEKTLELDSYCNWRSNWDGLKSESLTIWFGNPDYLSLIESGQNRKGMGGGEFRKLGDVIIELK